MESASHNTRLTVVLLVGYEQSRLPYPQVEEGEEQIEIKGEVIGISFMFYSGRQYYAQVIYIQCNKCKTEGREVVSLGSSMNASFTISINRKGSWIRSSTFSAKYKTLRSIGPIVYGIKRRFHYSRMDPKS